MTDRQKTGPLVLLAFSAIALLAGTHCAAARSSHGSSGQGYLSPSGIDRPDHDSALQARARGEILPLEEILQKLRIRPEDRLVDVVLDRRDGQWIYAITWLTKSGRYHILTVEAAQGRLLQDQIK
jgi:uncharacterized membrane protein YkoI